MKRKGLLILSIILMSIGFAAISTTLIINGNAHVSENKDDFSVIFTAATLDGTDVYSTVVDSTKKIITFETSELKTLNQTSVLTYEVTNNSSNYDANVVVTCVPKEGTEAKYTSIKNKLENDATVVKAKSSVNGTLTVTLENVATESVTEEYTCSLEFNAVERDTIGVELTQFQKDSWSTIAANVKAGNTDKYNIGDTKEVDLGSLGTHTVRVANKSACTTETSETACGFVVEFADAIAKEQMKIINKNIYGWPASDARTYINNTIYESLPSELQNVIVDTTVVSGHGDNEDETNFTSVDKLYLLSTKEVYGTADYDTVDTETKQLDYYKNLGVTLSAYSGAKKQYNGSNANWWLRSARADFDTYFTYVSGAGSSDFYYATGSYGISPAFRIA